MKVRDFRKKILSPASLARKVAAEKKKRRKVVFTNGCFDILHEGHVTYLQAARNLGDVMIVALDTDAAVRFQKGPERPINPLESRMKVMAGLEAVDYVTWFDKSTPLPLIEKFKPNVLAKGGDWKIDQIIGAREVLGWGGKVFSIPYVKGKSTTNIVKKIKG